MIHSEIQADGWNYSKRTQNVHYLLNKMSRVKNTAKKGKKKTQNAIFSKQGCCFFIPFPSVTIHSREMRYASLDLQIHILGTCQTDFQNSSQFFYYRFYCNVQMAVFTFFEFLKIHQVQKNLKKTQSIYKNSL